METDFTDYVQYQPSETRVSMPVDPETSKWEMDLQQDIETLKHKLLGETYNYQEQQWERKFNPMVNEQGAHEIIAYIESNTGKNASLTDFTPDEVDKHMQLIHRTFAKTMFENGTRKTWQIPSVSTAEAITTMVLEFIFPNKTRARDKTILNYRKAHETIRTIGGNTQRQGFMNKIMG